jgi:hypothetical protein
MAIRDRDIHWNIPVSRCLILRMMCLMSQSDGALYWKLREGKGIMPGFKSKLSDEQQWQLVEYIRDLSKPFQSSEKSV